MREKPCGSFWAEWAEGSVPRGEKGVLNSPEAVAVTMKALAKTQKALRRQSYRF